MTDGTPEPQARKAPMFWRGMFGAVHVSPSPWNAHVPVVSWVVAKKAGRYVAPLDTVVVFTVIKRQKSSVS